MVEDPEPWPDHAAHMRLKKVPKLLIGQASTAQEDVIEIRIPKVNWKRKLGIEMDAAGVVKAVHADGIMAGQSDVLVVGDRILELNGMIMDGQAMNPLKQPVANSVGSQVTKALAHLSHGDDQAASLTFLVARQIRRKYEKASSTTFTEALDTQGVPPIGTRRHAWSQTSQHNVNDGDDAASLADAEVEREARKKMAQEEERKAKQEEEALTTPALAMSNVDFGYGSADQRVLENIALMIPRGAKVGVLGRSGCGKSTLLKLMSRVYQPGPGGAISYFGEPLNDVVLEEYSTYMQQQNVLFDDTVMKNIVIGLEDDDKVPHDEAAVKEACLTAQLWHDVPTLGGGLGLQAPVGYRGKTLTGGQAQRVCLARCLLRRTPILFLDEPASAQDDRTVQDLSEALGELTYPPREEDGTIVEDAPEEPATVVAVTHNTTLLKYFTHACMMQHSKVVEYGPIEDLLKRKGHYYRLVMSRTGLSVDAKGRGRCTPERLRQVWVFALSPDMSLQTLSTKFVTRTLATDEIVYEKGADADAMYFLISGQIEAVEYNEAEIEINAKGDSQQAEGAKASQEAGALAQEQGGAAMGRRFVYMSGEDFGVEGLLDNTFRWGMHARVVSRKAVVLELIQEDLEEVLESDPALKDTAGEMIRQVKRLREPSSLALLWAFHGVPPEALKLVGEAMEADVAFEGSLLDEMPMDPCQALRVVVTGKVALLRASASDSEGSTETIEKGAYFGDFEMLPAPNKGSPEEVILSKQGHVQRAKAMEFTVILELTRSRLTALMEREAALADGVNANIRRWMDAIRPAHLRQHWLFCACPSNVLTLVSPSWKISAVPEGHVLIDGESGSWGGTDLCFLVLSGSVDVCTRRHDGREVTETVHAGSCVNSLALISNDFDIGSVGRPWSGPYGEVLWEAVASTTALILTLPSATFQQMAARYASAMARSGSAAGEDNAAVGGPIEQMRALAAARLPLLTEPGLRDTGALPKELEESHLCLLIRTVRMAVVSEEQPVLFALESDPGPQLAGGASAALTTAPRVLPRQKQKGSSSRDSPEIRGKPSGSHGAQAALPSCLYILLEGSLTVNTASGTVTLHKGGAFCSPLPAGSIEMPATTVTCTSAQYEASSSSCVLLCYDMAELLLELKDARSAKQRQLEIEQAEAAAQRVRERLKEQITQARRQVVELELRLGLRVKKDPKALWLWGLRRVQASRAFGIMPTASAKSPPLADVGGTLEETLAFLLKRIKHLKDNVDDREGRLKKAIDSWEALQPEVLPEEAMLEFSTASTDLTLDRLNKAEAAVATLTEMRQRERSKLVKQLYNREDHAELIQRAPGIDYESLTFLADACNEASGVLAKPMAQVQASLRLLWEELRIPEKAREEYEWTPGMPLDDDQLHASQMELARLTSCAGHVRQMELAEERDRMLAGETVGGMLRVMAQERHRSLEEEARHVADVRAESSRRLQNVESELRDTITGVEQGGQVELKRAREEKKQEQAEHEAELEQVRLGHRKEMLQLSEQREVERAELNAQLSAMRARLEGLQEELEIVRRQGGEAGGGEVKAQVAVQKILSRLARADKDKDGSIDPSELIDAFAKDEDGNIDLSELQDAVRPGSPLPEAFAPIDTRIPSGGTVRADGVIIDATGKPALGSDGKPMKARDARVPPGGSIGADGNILDADGKPLLGSDGKPVKAIDGRIPPGGHLRSDGIILDRNARPVLGPDGRPMRAEDPRVPAGGSIGEGYAILDVDEKPLRGPAGELITAVDPRIPEGGYIGDKCVIYDAADEPVLGPDHKVQKALDPRVPFGGSVSLASLILDVERQLVLGPNGRPMKAVDPRVPFGGSIRNDGIILDANGATVPGHNGIVMHAMDQRVPPGGWVGEKGELLDSDGQQLKDENGEPVISDIGSDLRRDVVVKVKFASKLSDMIARKKTAVTELSSATKSPAKDKDAGVNSDATADKGGAVHTSSSADQDGRLTQVDPADNLAVQKQEAIARGLQLLDKLGANESTTSAFVKQQQKPLKPANERSDAENQQVQHEVSQALEVVDNLSRRYEEDGLWLTLQGLMKVKRWSMRDLATALAEGNVMNTAQLSLERLRRFFNEHSVNYSDKSLDHILRGYAGSSLDEMERRPIRVEQFVDALEKLPDEPLYKSLLTSEQVQGQSAYNSSYWNRQAAPRTRGLERLQRMGNLARAGAAFQSAGAGPGGASRAGAAFAAAAAASAGAAGAASPTRRP